MRISTTVDATRLRRARRLCDCRDSELFDRALEALVELDERRREQAALEQVPYADDPDLDLPAPDIDWDEELPYAGAVPDEVVALARRRRQDRA